MPHRTVITGLLLAASSAAHASEPCDACTVERVGAGHRRIHTEVIIDAPVERVWAVLTDFEAMPEWSSTFRGLQGDFVDGATVVTTYRINPKRDRERTFEQTLMIEDGRQFGWQGNVFAFGMRDNHQYILEPISDSQTRFIQSDECTGGLTWAFGGRATSVMMRIYPAFNAELKERVESTATE